MKFGDSSLTACAKRKGRPRFRGQSFYPCQTRNTRNGVFCLGRASNHLLNVKTRAGKYITA